MEEEKEDGGGRGERGVCKIEQEGENEKERGKKEGRKKM
jgi:hypothetical protein